LKRWLVVGFAAALLVAALGAAGAFNALVALDQDVQAQWAQVENVYQRRADLVPNLVETVKGAAAFERETFLAVAKARAAVGISPGNDWGGGSSSGGDGFSGGGGDSGGGGASGDW